MPELPENSISACVIVRNEEAVLERCLASLDGVVDEIVFVHDGQPDDRSVEIAEARGARVFVRPLTGNPEYHTVFAYEQARGDWLLNIDGDEYLSEELRAKIRELAADPEVGAYSFLWRYWDGERYATHDGPFKPALFRKSKTSMLGILQALETIDGPTVESKLALEHKPLYNTLKLSVNMPKWRRWAKIQAAQYLEPFDRVPKFNYTGPNRWPTWRRIANALAPLSAIPYATLYPFVYLWRYRGVFPLGLNLRLAIRPGVYTALVQLYVAKLRYGRRR